MMLWNSEFSTEKLKIYLGASEARQTDGIIIGGANSLGIRRELSDWVSGRHVPIVQLECMAPRIPGVYCDHS